MQIQENTIHVYKYLKNLIKKQDKNIWQIWCRTHHLISRSIVQQKQSILHFFRQKDKSLRKASPITMLWVTSTKYQICVNFHCCFYHSWWQAHTHMQMHLPLKLVLIRMILSYSIKYPVQRKITICQIKKSIFAIGIVCCAIQYLL